VQHGRSSRACDRQKGSRFSEILARPPNWLLNAKDRRCSFAGEDATMGLGAPMRTIWCSGALILAAGCATIHDKRT
jgi:hypothetical protein